MIPVNGIWLFLYRMMTILCPSTYEKIFNFSSLTICLPTIALPFAITYPLWSSLNNFHYIRSHYGHYVPYFTETARSTLFSLCIFQLVCIQIIGTIVFLIIVIFHIKGKLHHNRILVLRGVSTYVMSSIPIWYEFYMIHVDRAKVDNEIIFLLQPVMQDIGYHIQPVLLVIFNRQIRVIVAHVLKLEKSSLTKLNTISPQTHHSGGKCHSTLPIHKEKVREEVEKTKATTTINIIPPSETPSTEWKVDSNL